MNALLRLGMLIGIAVAPAGIACAATPKAVSIDAATQRRLGIATAPLRATSYTATLRGFARVLDPIPLAQLDSDIAIAVATAAASEAEARRSAALHAADATVSARAAEIARMQARTDAARLRLLRQRLGLEWGAALTRLSDSARSALVAMVASGRAALLRIDTAQGAGQSGLRSVTIDLGDLGQPRATILGPARAADTKLQSPGLIAQVSGPSARYFSTGLGAPAVVTTATPRAGVIVPAAALVRTGGQSWAYVRTNMGVFQRRALIGAIPASGGLFVPGGFSPGEAIVVRGAAALLSAEIGGGPAEG